MTKIDLILKTPLFANNNFRDSLQVFIESQLTDVYNKKIDLKNIDAFLIFNTSYNLQDEISIAVRNAKVYIDFSHNAGDKILQNLIFLFLLYSLEKYPDNESWIDFLRENDDVKSKIIQNGITDVWLKLQSNLILNDLHNEIKNFENSFDDLPF